MIRRRVNRSYAVASLNGLTINRHLHSPRRRSSGGKLLTGQRRNCEIHDPIFPCIRYSRLRQSVTDVPNWYIRRAVFHKSARFRHEFPVQINGLRTCRQGFRRECGGPDGVTRQHECKRRRQGEQGYGSFQNSLTPFSQIFSRDTVSLRGVIEALNDGVHQCLMFLTHCNVNFSISRLVVAHLHHPFAHIGAA